MTFKHGGQKLRTSAIWLQGYICSISQQKSYIENVSAIGVSFKTKTNISKTNLEEHISKENNYLRITWHNHYYEIKTLLTSFYFLY